MIYKKLCINLVLIGLVLFTLTGFVIGTEINTGDEIYDGTLKIFIMIQKYSWPILTIPFIYAMYEYYVLGSKFAEKKFMGQRLMLGISIFMAIIQALPLVYVLILGAV